MFRGRAARPDSRPSAQRPLEGELDEREIAADLVPWLMERPKLSREQAELTVEGLRLEGGGPLGPRLRSCFSGAAGRRADRGCPEDSSLASASEPEEPVSRVLDRKANYVIVELPGAIYRLHKAGAIVAVGWVDAEPSATTAATLSLGPRPVSIHMYAGYAGPTHQMMTPQRGR